MSLNVVVYHVVEYVQAPAVGPLIAFEIDLQPPTADGKLSVNQLPEFKDVYKLLFITHVNNKNFFGLEIILKVAISLT